ncbi:MAG: hypothetical protein ACYTBJ_01605 [Planctomycetota bacterium]|jgi:hypothetical protein
MSGDKQTHFVHSGTNRGDCECLLQDLEVLLGKQIELAQEGDISAVEVLSVQADSLVEKIARAGILKSAEFGDRREHLRELYDCLCLSIAAKKAETAEELGRIRKGKKTIGAYRKNI